MIVNCYILLSLALSLPRLCMTLNFIDDHEISHTPTLTAYQTDSSSMILFFNVLYIFSTGMSVIGYLNDKVMRQIYFKVWASK